MGFVKICKDLVNCWRRSRLNAMIIRVWVINSMTLHLVRVCNYALEGHT